MNITIYGRTGLRKEFESLYDTAVQYVYVPALLVNLSSVAIQANPFKNNVPEIAIPVFMWDAAYEKTIQTALQLHLVTAAALPPDSVDMLHFGTIQLLPSFDLLDDATVVMADYLYCQDQPSTVTFRVNCRDWETCQAMHSYITGTPKKFVEEWNVIYRIGSLNADAEFMDYYELNIER